jgi:hypothetical protein
MTGAIEKPQLVIPINARHILGARDIARVDQDYFRKQEMGWLDKHNTLLKLIVQSDFEKMIKHKGIDNGQALMMGSVLANHAVRLCVADDPDEYARASQNHQRNYEADIIRLKRPGVHITNPWNTKEALDQVFGNEELSEAFMKIHHDTTRDSAAVTVGFFSLAAIPEIAYT